MNGALLRAEDEGMSGGEHAHLHKVLAALEHLKNLGSPEKLVRKISGENGPGRNAQTAARASVHPLHS
jgi:hypothetical protein